MNSNKNTPKKFQHYIPKFYLRFFSNNEKSVGYYLWEKNKLIKNASINEIGGKDYFYGKDGVVEDWFCELEGKWSILLKRIIESNKIELDTEEYVDLLMFIYLSEYRNEETANIINRFVNELTVTSLNMELPKEKQISYKEKIVSLENPNLIMIQMCEDIIPVLLDLRLILIVNQTSNQFITSDCIVAQYNQFAIEKGCKRPYGYSSKGIEMFLPISPHHCLCLYDDSTYIVKERQNVVEIKNIKEIAKINRLLAYNSVRNLFFNNSIHEDRLLALIKCKERARIQDNNVFESGDGEILLKLSFKNIDKNFMISFLKIKDRAKKDKIGIYRPVPNRDSLLIEKMDTESNNINNFKAEGKKFYLKKKD